MKGCERCGGQVLKNYGEESCLQCGYDPNGVISPNGAKPANVSPVPSRNGHKSGSQIFSSSSTQIRRRRRRLLLKGYSEEEADAIVKEQTTGG